MVYNDFLLQILLVPKQPLEVMVKSRKLVTKKFIFKFNKVKRFCHLLKMHSIRGFSRILYNPLRLVRIFRTPILEKTSWWLLLYVLEALVFQNTSKWLLLSSLSNRAIFFSKNFIWRVTQKSTYLHSRFNDERKFHHCFSSCFHGYFLRRHSSKTFLYRRNLNILISLILFRGKELYLPSLSISGNI